jgi:hypothetical protein
VSHVEIETTAIEKKPTVPGRLFVVTVVEIDGSGRRLAKEVVFNFGGPNVGIEMRRLLPHEASIFRLDAHDPIHLTIIPQRGAPDKGQSRNSPGHWG